MSEQDLPGLIIEKMAEGVLLARLEDGNIFATNPAFDRMFGYPGGELNGRNIEDLYVQNGVSAPAFPRAERISSATHFWTGEINSKRKDGSLFWGEISVSCLDHAQLGAFWLVVQRDISARKQTERAFEERREALAHVARISTVGELAASLAHELTQPLMAVEYFNHAAITQLQPASPEDHADVLELLHAAESQLKRAGQIVFGLRNFIRRGTANKKLCDVSFIVDDALVLMRPMLQKHSVDVSVKKPALLPKVNADTIQIEQVLINLLRNSVEAMVKSDSRSRFVDVGLDKVGDKVQVTIADSGPGIRPEQAETLFTMFETNREDTTTGMGLAISRSLIKAHGGKLWAQRDSLSRTVFCFTLPATSTEDNRIDEATDSICS